MAVQATRGCPYRCFYCDVYKTTLHHFRRSVDSIYEEVKMIADMGVKRIEFIEMNAINSKHKFLLIKGANNVAEIMASASVALINGGNIRYELCITKTPFVAISYVKSQDFYTKQLTNNGVGFFLGNYKEVSGKSLFEFLLEFSVFSLITSWLFSVLLSKNFSLLKLSFSFSTLVK